MIPGTHRSETDCGCLAKRLLPLPNRPVPLPNLLFESTYEEHGPTFRHSPFRCYADHHLKLWVVLVAILQDEFWVFPDRSVVQVPPRRESKLFLRDFFHSLVCVVASPTRCPARVLWVWVSRTDCRGLSLPISLVAEWTHTRDVHTILVLGVGCVVWPPCALS